MYCSIHQARSEIDKKNKLVAKYDGFYKELKRSIEMKEREKALQQQHNTTKTSPTSSIGGSGSVNENTSHYSKNTSVISHHPDSHTTHPSAYPTPTLVPPPLPPHQPMMRHKNPTTSTLEASLQRSAALEKKDRRR